MTIKTSLSYANEESFNYYVKYLALKKHFTTDGYNYHKYNGKIRASFETFRTRNDAYFFNKLAQKDDPINLMLANMIVKPNAWIREIVEETGEERYFEWKRKIDALGRIFSVDLNELDDNYQANFSVISGQHPYIMTLYLQKKISRATNLSTIFCSQ